MVIYWLCRLRNGDSLWCRSEALPVCNRRMPFMTTWGKVRSYKHILPEANLGLRVLSLPVSVCMGVCVSVYQSRVYPCDKSWPIQARIAWFGPKVQNTFGRQSTLTFKVKINFKIKSLKFVQTITHHPLKLEYNSDLKCKTTWLRLLLFGGGGGILDRFKIPIDS